MPFDSVSWINLDKTNRQRRRAQILLCLAIATNVGFAPINDKRVTVLNLSIVIPAHNEAGYIEATLSAAKDGLEQLGLDYEIIVVNDASTDATESLARAMGAKVVHVELRNIGAVRNAGARVARGKWLVFVDADTIVPKNTWQATVARLESNAIGGGATVRLSDSDNVAWYKYWMFPVMSIIWQRIGQWAAGCFMFCQRQAFDKMGGFPEEYFAAEEFFFSRHLKRQGRFELLKQPVFTSARKLHDFSTWQLLRFLTVPFLTTQGVLKSRRGLEVLYEHQRGPRESCDSEDDNDPK